jgi:tRNA(Ile)-lysidine synthetase-like protein
MKLHPLERRVLKTIQQHALIPAGSIVVVAVSGGVDSMALMHILHALAPRLGCTLHIATVDHMLRGEESAADAQFVADEAAKLGLVCTIRQEDVPKYIEREKKYSKKKPSIEMAARFRRYLGLSLVAHRAKASIVATAHHLNDQAETVLMRIISGTSLRGLSAMQFEDDLPYESGKAKRLIRPLLNTPRQDIEAYVAERGIFHREDTSNQNVVHKRNALRYDILPALRKLNPQVDQALARLAEQAVLETDYFDRELEPHLSSVVVNVPAVMNKYTDYITAPYTKINRKAFRMLDNALQRRLITWAYNEQRGTMQALEGGLTYLHVLSCVKAIVSAQVGKRINLPDGLDLRLDYEVAFLENERRPAEAILYSTDSLAKRGDELSLEAESLAWHPDWVIIARRSEVEIAQYTPPDFHRVSPQPPSTAELLVPRTAALTLRGRRNGDRFAPPGLAGQTQKIKQWMIDRKIPAAIRDRIPLVDVDGQVAAIFWDNRWTVAESFRAARDPNDEEQRIFISLYA